MTETDRPAAPSLGKYQQMMRALSCETADPVTFARSTIEWNNPRYGAELAWDMAYIVDRDGDPWTVTWVFDAGPLPVLPPSDDAPWGGKENGGWVVVVWWRRTPPPCDACDNQGSVPVYSNEDAVLYHQPCPVCRA